MQAAAEVGMADEGVGEFLAGADDVPAEGQGLFDLRGDTLQVGAGGLEEDARGAAGRRRGEGSGDGESGGIEVEVGEGAAGQFGVDVDRGDDV